MLEDGAESFACHFGCSVKELIFRENEVVEEWWLLLKIPGGLHFRVGKVPRLGERGTASEGRIVLGSRGVMKKELITDGRRSASKDAWDTEL